MLSCTNLQLKIYNKLIFNNVSFTLFPGSIHLIKGSNGSGKTSLLKAIAGLAQPNKGQISSEIDSSYLGHENAVKGNLSVLDNLLLWADLKNSHLLIQPAMAQFKLTEFADIKCKYLSAGWQRRLALARIIISNTKLWLLDEPETHLDAQGIELLLKLLQAKVSNGGMVIIASHNAEHYKKIPIINIEDFKYE